MRERTKNISLIWILALIFFLGLSSSDAQEEDLILIGEEIRIGQVKEIREDGRLIIKINGVNITFQLSHVSFPEAPSNSRAKAFKILRSTLQGKPGKIHIFGYLEGGRVATGKIVVGDVDCRFDLVKNGLARYCPGRTEEGNLRVLEQSAQEMKIGIWNPENESTIPDCSNAA